MTPIIGKFKNLTKNGLSGFLESPEGDLFFNLSQAKRVGFSESDFVKGKDFEVEIEPSDKGGFRVKNFIRKFEQGKLNQSEDNQKLAKNFRVQSLDINYNLWLNKPHRALVGSIFSDGVAKLEPRKKLIETKGLKNPQGFQFFATEAKETDFLEKLKSRHISNAKTLLGENNVATSICLKPDWRLALGIGGASVYETSITLHHIYGIPYIPASAVKGIVRSFIIQEKFDDKEEDAIQSQEFCDIFGCSKDHEIIKNKKKKKYPSYYKADREGKITFFDAFPIDKINISLDIMNVHYKDYYDSQDKNEDGTYKKGSVKPPADWSNPTIINFLTVQKTNFQFLVGAKRESDLYGTDANTPLKIDNKNIVEWLSAALTQKGIGAKTAVGYGYMTKET
ncbi:type III-B CRISPR module RAMP protein Cmr6 [Hugenholtzia roseola]|uniref:type III-B CRISPR module RAMP protein Cmr6 n=1 Tax=Hugenholtzia roseola TaxID=1002 RepID=UPI00047C1906|nr:type III-B CRISPR module RAMP protein Cmr6 [Hugenholtzia roseola]